MFRKALCMALAAALLSPLAAESNAQTLVVRTDSDYIDAQELDRAGLAKFWQFRIPLPRRTRLANVYLVDDALYCATNDGWLYALHAHTGVMRWVREVSDRNFPIKRPAHAGDAVIIATMPKITFLDRYFGNGLRQVEPKFAVGSAPSSDGVRYFIAGINGRFYAYEVVSGAEIWKAGTNGPISSRPALFDAYLFVAGQDAGVYAAVAENKRLHWQASTHGPNTADLVVDERGVFVASEDHSLYLFDLQFGQMAWRARFSSPLYEPPVLTADTAYQFCADDGLVAVNTGLLDVTERFRWKMPQGRSLLTVDQQNAYILTRNELIVGVRPGDGEIMHMIGADGFTIPVPSPADGAIFVASPDGRIFCARSKSVPYLHRDDLREALAVRRERERVAQEEAAAAESAETPAAPRPPADDFLRTERGGPPIGGKSNVSRGFRGEVAPPGGARPETPPPAQKPPAEKPDEQKPPG